MNIEGDDRKGGREMNEREGGGRKTTEREGGR